MIHKLLKWHEQTEIVKHVLELGGFIAGGYARYLSTPDDDKAYGDIDIFCAEPETHMQIDAYLMSFLDAEEAPIDTPHSKIFVITDDKFDEYRYNLINYNDRDFNCMTGLIESFDLDVCQVGLDKSGLYGTSQFVTAKTANFTKARFGTEYKITDPVGEILRLMKYAKKGFVIERSEIFKCLYAWEDMTPSERELSRITNRDES